MAAMPLSAVVDQVLAHAAAGSPLQVTADHLVMTAWLAYLKSSHLLPPEPGEPEEDGELEAERAWTRQRLVAMRVAAEALQALPRIGRDVFLRGAPEGLRRVRTPAFRADLGGLLRGYGAVLRRAAEAGYRPPGRPVVTLEAAADHMAARLRPEWRPLVSLLVVTGNPALARSALASGFAAGLELVKRGRAEVGQAAVFRPVALRST